MFHLPFTRRGKRLLSGPRFTMDDERAVVSFGSTFNVLVFTGISCLQALKHTFSCNLIRVESKCNY